MSPAGFFFASVTFMGKWMVTALNLFEVDTL